MQGLTSRKAIDFVEVPEEDLATVDSLEPAEEAAWEAPVAVGDAAESHEDAEDLAPVADATDETDESAFDHLLDGPQAQHEEDLVEASVEDAPKEKQPIATSANQGNWFKKWADKFIDLIDE
ncbi:MAG: hypothetical protein EBZ22_08695 [Flavobacteriia bacterium]|nr:hypothetical protein [Flavobacteriia bacterium]